MSITINGITRRNLQEQVGWNSEQIDKIFKIIDGLNIQDNVVVVPDMSHIMSDEELEIVKREVAFIAYNGSLYIKKSMDSSEAKFDIVFTISGGTAITFSSSEITVTLSNGALGIVNSTYSAYSTSQIDTKLSAKADTTYVDGQLALKANLSGADFTGDVTARTLSSNQAEFSADFNVYNLPAGLSIKSSSYKAFKVINNVLWIIAVLWLENTTESSVSGGFSLFYNNIPSDIGSKIYKADGTALPNASPAGLAREICDIPTLFKKVIGDPTNIYSRITSPSANRLDVSISNVAVDANSEALVSIRCPIILL